MKKCLIAKWVTSVLVLADGFFHLFTYPDALQKFAPDWILARGFFDFIGLPTVAHRIMGVFLILASGYAIYNLVKNNSNLLTKIYHRGVVPVTLFVIILATIVKIGGF